MEPSVFDRTPEAFGPELKERQAEAELRVMRVGETVSLAQVKKT